MDNKLALVSKRCAEIGISRNIEKCVFGIEHGVLLGHVVSSEGVTVDDANTSKTRDLLARKISVNYEDFWGMLITTVDKFCIRCESLD